MGRESYSLLSRPVPQSQILAGLWSFRPNASSYQDVSSRDVWSQYKFVPLQVRPMDVSPIDIRMYTSIYITMYNIFVTCIPGEGGGGVVLLSFAYYRGSDYFFGSNF